MKLWTDEEVNLLRKWYRQRIPVEEVARIVGHPVRSVVHKASELGIKREFKFFGKSWKKAEDEIIKKMYPASPKKDILSALPNRVWHTIVSRAHQLRVKRLEIAFMRDKLEKAENQLEKLPETDKAYFAGIMDSEGTIGISKYHSHKTGKEYYVTYLSLVTTSKNLVNWVEEKIFSKLSIKRRLRPKQESRLGSRPQYRFSIGTKKAYVLLKELLPYLVIKKTQAELFIRFAKTRLSKPRRAPYGEEEMRIYEEVCKLNELPQ